MTFRNAAQNLEHDVHPLVSAHGETIDGDERHHVIEALRGPVVPGQQIETAGELAERIARFRAGRDQQALENKVGAEYGLLIGGPAGAAWITRDVVAAMGAIPTAAGSDRNAALMAFRAAIYRSIATQINALPAAGYAQARRTLTDKLGGASGINEEVEKAFEAQWRANFAFEEILRKDNPAFTADLALEGLLGIVADNTAGTGPTPGDKWRALSRAAAHVLPHSSYNPATADDAKKKALVKSIESITTPAGLLLIQDQANTEFLALEHTRFHFGFRANETFVQFWERFRHAIENHTVVPHTGFAVEMHHRRDEAGAVIRAYVDAKGGDRTVSEEIRRYDRAYQRKMQTLHHLEEMARNDNALLAEFGRYHHHRFLHHTDPISERALDTAVIQVNARGAHTARKEHRQTEAELKKTRLETLKSSHVALTEWRASWLGMKTGWSWTQRAWFRSTWLKDKAIQAAFTLWNAPVATANVARSAGFVTRNRILRPWRWSPRAYLSSRASDLQNRATRATAEATTLRARLERNATPDLEQRTWNAAGNATALTSQEHATHELLQIIENRARAAANPAQAQSLLPQDYRANLVIEDQEIYDALSSVYNHSQHNKDEVANATLVPVPPMVTGHAAEIRALWQNLHPVRQLPPMPDAVLSFAHMIVERHYAHVNIDRPDQVLNLLRYANAVIKDVSTPINLPTAHAAGHTSHH